MSKNHTSGFHSSGQQQASELQNISEHSYRAAEQGEDSDHLKSHEQTRLTAEHHTGSESTGQEGIHTFGHKEIAALAYELWLERGCPEGSPDEDWAAAVKELRSRNVRTLSAGAKS